MCEGVLKGCCVSVRVAVSHVCMLINANCSVCVCYFACMLG